MSQINAVNQVTTPATESTATDKKIEELENIVRHLAESIELLADIHEVGGRAKAQILHQVRSTAIFFQNEMDRRSGSDRRSNIKRA